jgi:hypothetical protein
MAGGDETQVIKERKAEIEILRARAGVTKKQVIEDAQKIYDDISCWDCSDEVKIRDDTIANAESTYNSTIERLNKEDSNLGSVNISDRIKVLQNNTLKTINEKEDILNKNIESYEVSKTQEINIIKSELKIVQDKKTNITQNPPEELKFQEAKFLKEKEDLNEERDEELSTLREELTSRRDLINKADKNIVSLKQIKDERCNELEKDMLNNQVFRLARLLSGKNIACHKDYEKIMKNTFFLWFGSLALIISGAGSLLALASLVVANPPDQKKPLNKRSPFITRAFRQILLSFRKRLNNPRIVVKEVEKEVVKEVEIEKEIEKEVIKIVEVIKEVPVDKVVFKEVPVEVVKKEVVHVPVYTNDKLLLGKKKD